MRKLATWPAAISKCGALPEQPFSTFAATKAAKATIAVERARFYIVIDKHNLTEIVKLVENSEAGENSDIPGGDNISITYRFKNYGKTPG